MRAEADLGGLTGVEPRRRERGLWSDAIRALLRNRLAMAAIIVLLALIALAVAAAFLDSVERYDPYTEQNYERIHEGPSLDHFFGTDNLGRDNWSRVLEGVTISLQVGLGTQLVVLILGLAVGSMAALGGKTTDNALMRITDITYAFPDLLFIILMRAVLSERDWPVIGQPKLQVILAISFVSWVTVARLVRGQILSLKHQDFVDAARVVGASESRLILRHLLPNALAPVIVAATLTVGGAILGESALSYLGLGIAPPTASWGNMLQRAQEYIWNASWLAIFPGTLIFVTVLSFNFLGDGLRDALDPRLKL